MIDLLDILSSRKVVAVLRAPDASQFMPVARVLYSAGFRCIEFTLTTQGAIDALRDVRRALPEDVLLGIGTVRTLQQVDDALQGEADFLVSQTFNPEVIDAAQRRGVPFIPGTLTPTEVVRAWEHGVPAVKVSPVGPVGGPEYLTELIAPMPEVPVMATGGVTIDNGAEYLRRGAVAVGISRSLTGDALTPGGDLDALAQRAHTAVSGVAALTAP